MKDVLRAKPPDLSLSVGSRCWSCLLNAVTNTVSFSKRGGGRVMVHQLRHFSRHLSFSSLKTVSPEKNHSPHPQHTAPHDTGTKGSGVRAGHKINKQGLPLKLFINLNVAQYTNNTIFFFSGQAGCHRNCSDRIINYITFLKDLFFIQGDLFYLKDSSSSSLSPNPLSATILLVLQFPILKQKQT